MIADYQVVRSNRKTIGIEILSDGKVKVRVPMRLPEKKIIEIINEKSVWIEENQTRAKEKSERIPKYQYQNGEQFLYAGRYYPLEIRECIGIKRTRFNFIEDKFQVELAEYSKEKVKMSFEKWYRSSAQDILERKVSGYAKQIGEWPEKVTIREQKRRWGTCNSEKHLLFNWRLIMAPEKIMDYVVVHELCHIRHMNHSKQYWEMVESYMPDYRMRRKWLKENGEMLTL